MTDLPSFDLTGQTALVTGAARGLGRAISLALANAGANVALGLRRPGTGDDLVAEIEAMGRKALPLAMDVTDLGQVQAAIDETVKQFGRLDILVNNAGGGAPEKHAEDVPVEDFDHTVLVNLKGTYFTSQFAGRVMIRQGYGRIVNLSSQAGFVALPGESVYCMTKAGVSHLTKCLAVEWGKHGITVTPSRRPSSPRPAPTTCWPTRNSAPTWSSGSPRFTRSAGRSTSPAPWSSSPRRRRA